MDPSSRINQKIIGGKFGLPEKFAQNQCKPIFLEEDPILLFNARSGIKLVVDSLKPETIWLPSFICPSILTAIDNNKTSVKFYPINIELKIVVSDFIKSIQPGDIFLFIDYFGFSTNPDFLILLKQKGVILFQDCSQALFYNWKNSIADFCLYSPRKFLGVPDGGIIFDKNNLLKNKSALSEPSQEIIYHLFQAVVKRREFDLWGGDREWNELFQIGEQLMIANNNSMSETTRLLLNLAFDYPQIKAKRRDNFSILLCKLSHFAVFKSLPDDVVPIGFPIRLNHRDEVQKKLFSRNIYPPIHWRIINHVPEEFSESHQLSEEIMTLPCDQRYDEEQIKFLANILLESLI